MTSQRRDSLDGSLLRSCSSSRGTPPRIPVGARSVPGALKVLLVAVLLVPGSGQGSFAGQEEPGRRLEDWMPGDVAAFVKIDDVGEKLRSFLKSAWWRELRASTLMALVERQDGFRAARNRLEELESEIGKKGPEFLDDFIGEGLLVGLRPSYPGEVLVIARSRSEADLARSMASLKDATRVQEVGLPGAERTSHRGVVVEGLGGKLFISLLGDTLLASNSAEAVKAMIDLARGASAVEPLSRSRVFAPSLAREEGAPPILQAAVLPNYVPGLLGSLPARSASVPASVLGAGWLERLRGSELVSSELRLSDRSIDLRLCLRSPGGTGSEAAERAGARPAPALSEIFFPRRASALERAELHGLEELDLLGLVHLRRDLSAWWEGREHFLNRRGLEQLASFSSAMSVALAGRSFQDEVLPRLEDGLTLLCRRARHDELGATPSPELPAFAAILRLEDASGFRSQIAGAFNTLALILNAQRLREGETPAFVSGTRRVGKVRMYTLSLPVPQEDRGKTVGAIYNFAPAVAVLSSRVVIGSRAEFTADLIRALVQAKPVDGSQTQLPFDQCRVRVAALDDLLRANRSVLASAITRLEGVGREEAEMQLRAISEILSLFEDFRISGRCVDPAVELRMRLRASSRITDRAPHPR